MKSLLVLSAEENAESMGCHQFRSVADPNGRCDPCMRRKRASKPHSPASAVGPATGPAASVRPHTLTSSPPIMDIVSDTVRYISSAHSLPTFNHLLIVHKLPSSFLPFPLSLYPLPTPSPPQPPHLSLILSLTLTHSLPSVCLPTHLTRPPLLNGSQFARGTLSALLSIARRRILMHPRRQPLLYGHRGHPSSVERRT